MNNNIYEISLAFTREDPGLPELLLRLLEKLGIPNKEVVEHDNGLKRQVSFFVRSPKRAYILKKNLERLALNDISISLIRLKNADWQTRWKENFQPFNITKTIQVAPTSMKNTQIEKNKKTIFIDTDIVFGTGLHPTTRMVAEFIEKKQRSFKTFLDIGTGTGILSIIASLRGGKTILSIDTNPEAIKTAKRNFNTNQCPAAVLKKTDIKHFSTDKHFDFVAANLLTEDLIGLRKKIISLVHTGKYLAVSGISLENYISFRERFEDNTLKCLAIKKQRGWTALLYKKK